MAIAAYWTRITTAPSLGPLLGGVLAFRAGWVFWFLTITSAAVLLAMVLILPETARTVVGNGSIPPPLWSRPWLPAVMRPWNGMTPQTTSLIFRRKTVPNPLRSLEILCRLDTAVSILAGSIIYMVYCSSHASLSTVFSANYSLNQLQTGLVYLPFGLSSLVSTVFSGKLIDYDYKTVARHHNLPRDRIGGDDLRTFPIEEARLRNIFVPTLLACGSMVGYGWASQEQAVRCS